ncbi:inositol monophosphatase 1-like [Mytilus californianus]|uniref:inositol monophosphatase 1-like n=1 Tax=Mytilus californianus TaxID=6549 RepID=UPI002247BF46|nr:inositol monophosphatase 1-like [Mytilus californianus]
MSTAEIQDYLKTAIEVAKEAGEVVREAFYKEKSLQTKSNYADLVTETDQAVEKQIINSFKEKYPTHKFIGEESVAGGHKTEWTDDPTWIIDPIDGTTNFVHQIPHTCVCIGLSIKKQMVVGVVYAPILNEMYTGARGQGAFCNGERISTSQQNDLKQAIIYLEGGSSREPDVLRRKCNIYHKVLQTTRGTRTLGSAAMNMVNVAKGSGDAYVEYGLHIWDFAASGVILIEAGGAMIDPSGGPVDFLSRRILCASSQPLADQLSTTIPEHIEMERD